MIKYIISIFLPRNTYSIRQRMIALHARIIFNKALRHRWKHIQSQKMLEHLVTRARWGVSYSVFDGEELLESSIKSIRKHVDYINVVYQKSSWYGNPADPKLPELLKKLKSRGLIDELIEYIPDHKLNAGKQEVLKRNIGLKYAKRFGCDYFMCMDTDEFYVADEMRKAKKFIIENGITHSFCPVFAYRSPTQRYLRLGGCYVQFLSRVTLLSRLKRNKHNITLVDPTRHLNHVFGAKYYVVPGLEMHHMICYRKDIIKKMKNSSFVPINNMTQIEFEKSKGPFVNVADMFNIPKLNGTK